MAEIERLRNQVRELSARLEDERTHRRLLERAVGYAAARARALELADPEQAECLLALDGPEMALARAAAGPGGIDGIDGIDERGNVYVFDDEDASRVAFDEFFGAHDPHLDKVRGFLLD
ncbi:MAG: hypothetical protein WBM50_13475 [Acidimicrobiales bacterium]